MSRSEFRRCEAGRLVYYRVKADQAYWNSHWRERVKPESYQWAEKGALGYCEETFLRHLPREGKIIEAGCGVGKVVMALRARGYDCEGVEWSGETVEAVNQLLPDLPVRAGDVTSLKVPDGHYGAYISLGVIEHRQEGPEPFLKEAYRVLAPDGVMVVSVPFFNILRRLKARLGLYRGGEFRELEFYQQAFSVSEMAGILSTSGFEVVGLAGGNPGKVLKDEVSFASSFFGIPYAGPHLVHLLGKSRLVSRYLGHMIVFACRKTQASGSQAEPSSQ